MASDLWRISDQYRGAPLDPAECDPDPIAQFRTWFQVAHAAGLPKVNAMTLATVDAAGRPTARIVLMKGVDARGVVFHTNYDSRKGRDLAANPRAALLFFWVGLERQVRIDGAAERVSAEDSDAYFAARPRGSQISAWASPQSARVADRAWLEARVAEFEARFASGAVPRPPNWGGMRVVPDRFEFWQGRTSRLHDRLVWSRQGDRWTIERLAP